MIGRIIKGVEKKSKDVNRVIIILVIQAVFVMTYVGALLWIVIFHPESLNPQGVLTMWHIVSYLPPALIGPPIVYFLLRSLIYRYMGSTKVTFRTYVDSHFYNDFVRFSSKYRLEGHVHSQRNTQTSSNNRIYDRENNDFKND